MTVYYVNKKPQDNGDHEVHKTNCPFLPNPKNRQFLGDFDNSHGAVQKATKSYEHSYGCYHCSNESHPS